jgi:hypothetical protein
VGIKTIKQTPGQSAYPRAGLTKAVVDHRSSLFGLHTRHFPENFPMCSAWFPWAVRGGVARDGGRARAAPPRRGGRQQCVAGPWGSWCPPRASRTGGADDGRWSGGRERVPRRDAVPGPAQQGPAGDGKQPPLLRRSGSFPRLRPGVRRLLPILRCSWFGKSPVTRLLTLSQVMLQLPHDQKLQA